MLLSSTSPRNTVLAWTQPVKADAIVVLKSYVRRPVLVFCLLKHALSAIYSGLVLGSLWTITSAEAQTVQVYSVHASIVVNGALLLAHLCRLGPLLLLLRRSQRRTQHRPSARLLWLETRTASCVFQALELGMQSFQAWRLSFYTTSMTVVCIYTSCTAINCLVSPLLLTSRAPFVHRTLRLFVNGVLGFTLNTAFPLLDFGPRMYAKKFQPIAIASQLRNDASWLTVTSLGMRGYSSNTLPSLVCKVLLGALNLWTMQLLAQSVLQMAPRARACAIMPPPRTIGAVSPHNEKVASRLVSLSELQKYWNRRPTRPAKTICLALIVWGLVLLANLIWLLVSRSVCPSTCKVAVTPLFQDTTCYCAYAHVHCTTTNDDDNDDGGVAFLQSQLAPLGTRLFYLEIDHCPLPHGVPAHVLAPLTTLYALRVLFSNMTSFDGVGLPSSLMVLELRYSALTVAPTVVTSALPPMLLSLYLDGSRIPHLGLDVIRHWRQLTTLHVTETPIGDDDFVTIVRELPNLSELALHHTRITALPPELFRLPSLQTVFLSSCAITAWPSQPVTPLDGFLDLSCNPLTRAPSWVQVDALCEASCSSLLRTNSLCNYVCDDAPACAPYFP